LNCNSCSGRGVSLCKSCHLESRKQAGSKAGPPAPGVSISPCSAGELTALRSLWNDRGSDKLGLREVEAAWVVDNPLLSHTYQKRREELRSWLKREPDELQGFHGTMTKNVISIVSNGFNPDCRRGQVFGSGEYFAMSPWVSMDYCHGEQYMLVCRLCLGVESSDSSNYDGDHIWVQSQKYYVIAEPSQILPQHIIKFKAHDNPQADKELLRVLSLPRWSTKREEIVDWVPENRLCAMSMPTTDALWMGFLHANVDDDRLEADVKRFFEVHAPDYAKNIRVHIASGKYKKAHVEMRCTIPKDVVHELNKRTFVENGVERFITVDDAHGSPSMRCPRWIARYCRGRNLRFTHSCWCKHEALPTANAKYYLQEIDQWSAKGTEIWEKFMQSAPFHDGSYPTIVKISAIQNHTLSRLHEEYRGYLRNKNKEEPVVRELYHGTNNNILDVLYQHGLQPPSDTKASEMCPVSGGKGLCTTLCNNDCQYCTEKHDWNKCHMFGLGIYLADLSQKSHRYCSMPQQLRGGRRRFRMVICSVLGRSLEVAGHLTEKAAMHDVVNVRALGETLKEMIEPQKGAMLPTRHDVEGADILAVKGLGPYAARPGFSVINSEYIAYHPYQCLPKYEITYEV